MDITNTLQYVSENKDRFLKELFELLEIPSISAQPEHNHDMTKTAEMVKKKLEEAGMEKCEVFKTAGHPIVYAEYFKDPSKPTVLIYGHYDVQSPDPLEQWISKPFEPEVRSGNIYGRGTADNKGQFFTHVKSVESILKTAGKLPVNVKFLIEGEEEVGGPSLDKFIGENESMLKADICLISDTHSLSPSQPMMDYGLRGIVYTQIDLEVMPKDVHSGLYGGNVPSATAELARIIGKLKNLETQEVLIDGFYDNVRKIESDEQNSLSRSHYTEKSVLDETNVKKLVGVEGFSPIVRAGARPTLDVNGMWGGYTGEGAKTIIPAKASAKISMRIVPNQTAKEIEQKFETFILANVPDYADVKVNFMSSGEPILMNISSEYYKKAESALEQTFGNKPIYELSGGSIPVTATIKNILGIDSIMMGFGLPDDGLHSPNEKLSLEMFYKGIESSIRFLSNF